MVLPACGGQGREGGTATTGKAPARGLAAVESRLRQQGFDLQPLGTALRERFSVPRALQSGRYISTSGADFDLFVYRSPSDARRAIGLLRKATSLPSTGSTGVYRGSNVLVVIRSAGESGPRLRQVIEQLPPV